MWGGTSATLQSLIAWPSGQVDVTKIVTSGGAYAAIRANGSVVTWGTAANGGDSSSIASQLNGTIRVVDVVPGNCSYLFCDCNYGAFAALREDGSVITWGWSTLGGNSSSVAADLNGAVKVTAITKNGGGTFAAIREDGSVIVWGPSTSGGSIARVASYLNGANKVISIASQNPGGAYAALRADGSVITWGSQAHGGVTRAPFISD